MSTKNMKLTGGSIEVDSSVAVSQVVTGTQANPTVLTRSGDTTIILTTHQGAEAGFVRLPPGCSIGDVFEVHGGAYILPPQGESFLTGADYLTGTVRKLLATVWSSTAS